MFCAHCGNAMGDGINFCSKCGNKVGSMPVPTPGGYVSAPPSNFRVASTGTRFANYIVDFIILFVLLIIFFIIAGSIFGENVDRFGGLVYFFGYFFYYFLFEGTLQRTPGKFLTKTKVVMKDGSKPTWRHILGRSAARFIPFDNFSFLFGGLGWHDSLSSTRVVSKDYTPEQVKQINYEAKSESNSAVVIIVFAVVGIAVIGLIASVVLLSLNSARTKSRDAQRLSDARMIQTKLEAYWAANETYPKSLEELSPKYLDALPKPPEPNDGTCSKEQNAYVYKYISPDKYSLQVCLGLSSEGHNAGIQEFVAPE